MKMILFPLAILITVAISVQMINLMPIQTEYSGTINSPVNSSQLTALGVAQQAFNITVMTGFISFFVSLTIIGILSGTNISVLGSTVQISERAQNILYNGGFYGGLCGIFSVLATTGINGLGLFAVPAFGIIFYIIMTLIYVLGINQQIQSGK